MKRKTKAVLSVILLTVVFIYPTITQGADKDSVSVKLVWEKEFNSPVKDFSFTEEKGFPTLQTIIKTNEVIFGEGKGAKRINVSGFMSPNGEYIGVPRVSYGDKDNVLQGSKFYIYDKNGDLILERKVTGKTGQPIPYILNNGNPIFTLNPWGWSHLGILDKNTGKIIKEVYPAKEFWSSGHLDMADRANLFVVCTVGGEKKPWKGIVILYDSNGNEIWKRFLGPGRTGHVSISPYGKYISAIGSNKWVSILTVFDKNGHELWKKKIGAATDIIKFSPDDNILVTSSSWHGLKCFELSTGNMLWIYHTDKFTERDERGNPKSSMSSLDISSDGSLVSSMDSKGKVYLFNRKGNLLKEIKFGDAGDIKFSIKDRFLLISAGKKIYCYEIRGK